jgi:hypothetical protein
MFSNLLNVEGYVSVQERQSNRRYLRRVDIMATERGRAMAELHVMGITATTMFPGLEGVCRGLSERFF